MTLTFGLAFCHSSLTRELFLDGSCWFYLRSTLHDDLASHIRGLENSIDPDQTPQNVESDQRLLCLPKTQQFLS